MKRSEVNECSKSGCGFFFTEILSRKGIAGVFPGCRHPHRKVSDDQMVVVRGEIPCTCPFRDGDLVMGLKK